MAGAESELDAAFERVALWLGELRLGLVAERQSAAPQHPRQPLRDPFGEQGHLVQRGSLRGPKPERPVRLLVEGSVGYEQVEVRVNVEASACPLQDRDPAHASTTAALALPSEQRVVDQPYRRREKLRPEGEQTAQLERQADDDLPVRNIREHVVQEVRRPVTHVPRRAGGAK